MSIFSEQNVENVAEVVRQYEGKPRGDGETSAEAQVMDSDQQQQRMQELFAQIDRLADSEEKAIMQDGMQEIINFYGIGIKRMLQIISKSHKAADIYNELISDGLISNLLLIHNLHPLDVKTRMYNALEKLRPYVEGHGGSIEIASIEGEVATIRMSGSCKGCPSSASTLEIGIRKLIQEHCPEIVELEILGVDTSPINMLM